MPRQIIAFCFAALVVLFARPNSVIAEMGPCVPTGTDIYAGEDILTCGTGEGSARVIPKTISPSKRLALAWRFTDRRPPTNQPLEHDRYLENVIVRIGDGTIVAKTHGTYWVTGGRTQKANVIASWSPDSHLFITGMESTEFDTAELFTFGADNTVTGPFDLVKVLEPAVRAQVRDSKKYSFRITYIPGIAIDDQGLIHASVYMARRETRDGPAYENGG